MDDFNLSELLYWRTIAELSTGFNQIELLTPEDFYLSWTLYWMIFNLARLSTGWLLT